MGVPLVNKCFFSVNLRIGTLIIAYLYSLWALAELAIYVLVIPAPVDWRGQLSIDRIFLFITAAAISFTHFVSSLVLIVAAHKKVACPIISWMIITVINTIMFFLMFSICVYFIVQKEGRISEGEIIYVTIHSARACVSVYCLVVVYSRYKQMMSDEDKNNLQHSERPYHAVKTEDHVPTNF